MPNLTVDLPTEVEARLDDLEWLDHVADPGADRRELIHDYGDDIGYDRELVLIGRLAALTAKHDCPWAAAQAMWGTP